MFDSCCLSVQYTGGSGKVCEYYANQTGPCNTPVQYNQIFLEGFDSVSFIGMRLELSCRFTQTMLTSCQAVYTGPPSSTPPTQSTCTNDQILTLNGILYQTKCKRQAVSDRNSTTVEDASSQAPENKGVADCAAFCAAKQNCCAADFVKTGSIQQCFTMSDTKGCRNANVELVDASIIDAIVLAA